MPQTETVKSKKDELLEIASRLFYEQGYYRTGVKQIIDEAGIAKGTFYSHFKSKEDLGVAWLKARHNTWNAWLEKYLDEEGGDQAASKIKGLFDFLEDWMQGCGYRGCAFLNTLTETPEGDSPLRKEIESHKRSLLAVIQSLVNEHVPADTEAERVQLAQTIFIIFEGALIEMQNFRDTWPAKAAKEQIRRLLE
ncbi:MAG: TetR/AcrR family transcriptional regulator [Verrucomicrobia bacterium]|nr:TetR/AcrR family transcriptional regulator [Verrucomicrobiota bacterium]